MIEIPIQYLFHVLTAIALIFNTLWTALGVYFLGTREIFGGIVVLGIAVIFWLIILTMLEIVAWV